MAKKKKLTVKIDNNLLTACLYVIIGILCTIFKSQMLEWMFTIIGALFIVNGVFGVLRSDWVNATINIVIGVIIILFAWVITQVVLIVFGVLIILKGAQEIMKASKNDVFTIVAGAITLLVGVLLIVAYWASDWIFIAIGIVFIVDGIAQLIEKK